MPKATLTFDLSDPDDQEQFNAASQAQGWVLAMFDVDIWLRKHTRYPSILHDGTALNALEAAREQLHEILQDKGLDLDVLS